MPFIINEDEALKQHLSGLTVSDSKAANRPVKVWYRLPEAEERQITYPFITIDLIDVAEEFDRAHRGPVEVFYEPEGYTNPIAESQPWAEFPTPVTLTYQITTHTRSAWHDRSLLAQMYGNKIPLRYGALVVPADDTVRRMDLIDMRSVDGLDQNNKRVFRKAYTVNVSAEIFIGELATAEVAQAVDLSLFHKLTTYIDAVHTA